MTWLVWTGIAALGGAGAILRFVIDASVQRHVSGEFPLGTLTVNMAGSFLLGILTGAGVRGNVLLLTGTAVLGSFTTFSTWMLETERLAEEGDDRIAVSNILVSAAAGLGAALAGWSIGSLA